MLYLKNMPFLLGSNHRKLKQNCLMAIETKIHINTLEVILVDDEFVVVVLGNVEFLADVDVEGVEC